MSWETTKDALELHNKDIQITTGKYFWTRKYQQNYSDLYLRGLKFTHNWKMYLAHIG